MGKPTGFKEYARELPKSRPAEQRVRDYKEFYEPFPDDKLRNQAARCMDCGVPFCHTGCPLGNIIPDWNDLVYRNRWREAIERLHATNNFPEFTGRLCPAPCEEACVLSINEPAVTIEQIEKSIIEHAFEEGWIAPQPPERRTGKTVAVVGSGPAGLACAQQLNRAGHTVTVFERAPRIGGLLRYGIPDFKLEKWVIDRRLQIMEKEGITFKAGVNVGKDLPADELKKFDAVVLCGGATKPRDLPIPGRELDGIHFAMDFLTQQNDRVAGVMPASRGLKDITATGKRVIVIGGGDTGSDCIGTSNRQGAKSITSFELLPMPPEGRPAAQPWPYWPMRLRASSSHKEGGRRFWSILTKKFIGAGGHLRSLITVNVEAVVVDGKLQISGSARHGTRVANGTCPSRARIHRAGAGRRHRSARRRTRPVRQREVGQQLYDHRAGRFLRRRHAPRPVARRLGDFRRPRSRARRGSLPDGLFGTADERQHGSAAGVRRTALRPERCAHSGNRVGTQNKTNTLIQR